MDVCMLKSLQSHGTKDGKFVCGDYIFVLFSTLARLKKPCCGIAWDIQLSEAVYSRYKKYIKRGLRGPDIFRSCTCLQIEHPTTGRHRFWFDEVTIEKPVRDEATGAGYLKGDHKLMPRDCREMVSGQVAWCCLYFPSWSGCSQGHTDTHTLTASSSQCAHHPTASPAKLWGLYVLFLHRGCNREVDQGHYTAYGITA